MDDHLDDVDRRILYHLMRDARDVSAPEIAEEVNVSPGTIRNRIRRLESAGVITGYHAAVDFEAADAGLQNLFICRAPIAEREALAAEVLQLPGVVNVRELFTGGANLHVVGVGEDMDEVTRIARAISALGIDIEDEELVKAETTRPYGPFGPDEGSANPSLADLVSLTGGAEVVELTVAADAPVVGHTLDEADSAGLIGEESLVIAIERGDGVLTPKGDVTVEAGDLVTLFARNGNREAAIAGFTGERTSESEG